MDDNGYKEVRDAEWESIYKGKEDGGIKFRKIKKLGGLNAFLKIIFIIVIAVVSGGIAGAYVVNKIYTENGYVYTKPNIQIDSETTKASEIPSNSINKVAQIVGPAVVSISSSSEGLESGIDESSGSGIIFDSKGYIVTNNHVVDGADKLTVKLSGGKVLSAKLIGTDPRTDIAVIKVNAQNLPIAKFGDSSKAKVGDLAVAIGNPMGEYAGSVTVGIISAVNRTINYEGAKYKVLQTDAAINPGNSGGALCNEAGEVIGINSLKVPNTQNGDGIGFAIAVNEVKNVINSLVSYGKVSRPYLGISGGTVKSDSDSGVKGVYISEVVQGSGAAAAGVKPTDIIVQVDNKKVETIEQLQEIVEKHKIGDAVPCIIWRNGKDLKVNIILSDSKNSEK
jgi:serine protease Do